MRNNISVTATLLVGLAIFVTGCKDEEKIKIVDGPYALVLPGRPTDVEITWETDFPGNSKVMYGVADLDCTYVDDEERQVHTVTLTGLHGKTLYYFRVKSKSFITDAKVKSGLEEFTTGENEESLARTGWEFYQEGNIDSAQWYFDESLLFDSEYGWTYVGFGWLSIEGEDLNSALIHLNNGLGYDPTLLDGYVGRAAVNLTLNNYNDVIDDGNVVINTDNNYLFRYKPEINFQDVRIMLSQAYYAKYDFESAQTQCDVLSPENGLDPALPSTWVVDGISYETYNLALLGLINYIDTLY